MMSRLAIALILLAGAASAQSFPSGMTVAIPPAVSSISLTATAVTHPFSGIIATITPACTPSPCPPTDANMTFSTGGNCTLATIADNSAFSIFTSGTGWNLLSTAGSQTTAGINGTALTVNTYFFAGAGPGPPPPGGYVDGTGNVQPIAVGNVVLNHFSGPGYTTVAPGTQITALGNNANTGSFPQTFTVNNSQTVPYEGLLFVSTLSAIKTYHIGIRVQMSGTTNQYQCFDQAITVN